jgi:hypothetical protein
MPNSITGQGTDVTGTITAHQLQTPKTIKGTSYDWEAIWKNATFPNIDTERYVSFYGWSATTSPLENNYNLYQLATPTRVQLGLTTYTAYFNMPTSYPVTGEQLEFQVEAATPLPESPMFNTANLPSGQTPEVPWAAGLPLMGLAVGGWFWKRQTLGS